MDEYNDIQNSVASSCQRLSLKRKRRESIHNGIFGNSNGKNPLKRACSSYLQFSLKDLGAIFDHYSCGTDLIESKGMLQFCKDLRVDTMDVALLVLSYQMNVAECGVFTREEFINGLTNLGIYSMDQIQEALPSLRQFAITHLNEIYVYAFHSLKEYESQLTIPLEGALEMIRILTTHLSHGLNFIHFMKTRNHEYLGMNFDQWTMFLQFNLQISLDFENYDENGCWPVMIDDFVAYMRSEEKLEEPLSYYESSFETESNQSNQSFDNYCQESPYYNSQFTNNNNFNNNNQYNQMENSNLFSSTNNYPHHDNLFKSNNNHNTFNNNDNNYKTEYSPFSSHYQNNNYHNHNNDSFLLSSNHSPISRNSNTLFSSHSYSSNQAETTSSNSLFSSSCNRSDINTNNINNRSENLVLQKANILFSSFHNQNSLFLHKEDSFSDSCSEVELGMDVI